MTKIRISADRESCIGAAMCSLAASDLFDQDTSEGLVVVLSNPVDITSRRKVEDAVSSCPSGALSFAIDPETVPDNTNEEAGHDAG